MITISVETKLSEDKLLSQLKLLTSQTSMAAAFHPCNVRDYLKQNKDEVIKILGELAKEIYIGRTFKYKMDLSEVAGYNCHLHDGTVVGIHPPNCDRFPKYIVNWFHDSANRLPKFLNESDMIL